MPHGISGLSITKCVLTTYPAEQEKAPGFSPPTAELSPADTVQALSAGRALDTLQDVTGKQGGTNGEN